MMTVDVENHDHYLERYMRYATSFPPSMHPPVFTTYPQKIAAELPRFGKTERECPRSLFAVIEPDSFFCPQQTAPDY